MILKFPFLTTAVLLVALTIGDAKAQQVVTTVSGTGTLAGDIFLPSYLALDSQGDVLVVTAQGRQMAFIGQATGKVSLFGDPSNAVSSGDGGLITLATFESVGGLAIDAVGTIVFVDGNRIRRVDAKSGIVSTICGGELPGFAGDGGPALSAKLATAGLFSGLALDSAGNIYFADTNNFRIRKIDAKTLTISTLAGNGTEGTAAEGTLAVSAALEAPGAVAVDGSGNVYFTELRGVSRVRKVSALDGTLTTVAGTGISGTVNGSGFSGDGGPALTAMLSGPLALTIDPAGNLIIADSANGRLRQVNRTTRTISTLVGGGTVNSDGCAPQSAVLFEPWGMAFDAAGNLFFADTFGLKIRRLGSGSITNSEDTDLDGFSDVLENVAGSNPLDARSTPFSPNTSSSALIAYSEVHASFSSITASSAKMSVTGSFFSQTAPSFDGQRVVFALGGLTRTFILKKSGSGKIGRDGIRFTYKKKTRLTSFTLNLNSGDFRQVMGGTTFTIPTGNVSSASEFLLFQNTIYGANVDLSFSGSVARDAIRVTGAAVNSDFGTIRGRH